MGLIVIGVSHHTAPVEIRERLSIPQDELPRVISMLKDNTQVSESVLLSTCNRLEIYARPKSNRESAIKELSTFVSQLYPKVSMDKILYSYESRAAINHLFTVASGLDSLVLGETEILGQVKSAYQFSMEQRSTGKVTNVLFQRALYVGKSVRNITNISEGASSVGSIAVRLAEKIFGSLHETSVLLLGAGEIAEVTARHLISQKAKHLTVLNRTLSKAEELARLLNGKAGVLGEVEKELMQTDIVVCSASSDVPLVTKEMMENVMKRRRMKSLYFIDLAVPRNVDPAVHQIDNVYVYNIDDLKYIVEESMSSRKKEIDAAKEIVSNMTDECFAWLQGVLEGRDVPMRHQWEKKYPRESR